MFDLATAVFPFLSPSPVFLCFITHTLAIKLRTTISFHCYTKYTTHIPHIKAKRPLFPFNLLFLPCTLFECALRITAQQIESSGISFRWLMEPWL